MSNNKEHKTKLNPTLKILLIIFINICPFAVAISLYSLGGMFDLVFFPLTFGLLTVLNYFVCKKTLLYVAMQSIILVSCVLSGFFSTYLYYHNISNDWATPAVGMLLVFLEVIIIFVVTLITSIIKAVINKEHSNYK